MQQEQLVVIGGTAAGLSAASAAKRACPDWNVRVFEKTGYVGYGSCGLPYFIGDIIKSADDLIAFTPEQMRQKRGVDVRVHHEALSIDRAAKTILVQDLAGGGCAVVPYTKLVIATGASPIVPPIPGIDRTGVFTVRCVEDGIAVKRALGGGAKQVVCIGGGFIGLELTAELAACGHRVSLLEAMPRLLPMLPEAYAQMVVDTLENNGVTVALNTRATAVEGNAAVESVRTEDGRRLPAQLVIAAVGVRPNGALAADAGLAVAKNGAILVDAYQRTSDSGIFACGDCVQMFDCIDQNPAYFPLGTTANKQGKLAGLNAAGANKRFPGVLGSQITKVFELYVGATGLSLASALSLGYDAACCSVKKADRASYYPGATDNHITLVFEKSGGRLLGAQAAGGCSIAGRLNVAATAIAAGMTIEMLNGVDFVYAPPVAPVYDPMLIAASQSLKRLG